MHYRSRSSWGKESVSAVDLISPQLGPEQLELYLGWPRSALASDGRKPRISHGDFVIRRTRWRVNGSRHGRRCAAHVARAAL